MARYPRLERGSIALAVVVALISIPAMIVGAGLYSLVVGRTIAFAGVAASLMLIVVSMQASGEYPPASWFASKSEN